jgi:hypothetical protein
MRFLGTIKNKSKRSGGGGSGSGISPYNPATAYAINDIVNYNGILYVCIQAGTGKQPNTNADYWSIYDQELTSVFINDPAINEAVSTLNIDAHSGAVVILSAPPNAQTFQSPTNLTDTKQYMIINDRTSSDNLVITTPLGDTVIEPGHGQNFFWTGTEWSLGGSLDADQITAVPSQFNSVTVQGQLDEISDIMDNQREPTGIITPSDISVTYNVGTREITIQPTGASFQFYSRGKIFTKTAPEVTTAHANTTGVYFLYYHSDGTLQFDNTGWDFNNGDVMVAYVYYDATKVEGVLFEERHGITMDQDTHGEFHNTIGCYVREWGFALADYNLQPSPVADSDNQFSIATGKIADEDIISELDALSAAGPYAVWYRSGASGDWTWDDTRTVPYMDSGTWIQYNEDTGATFQLSPLANNQYMNMYVLASPTWDKGDIQRFPVIVGQAVHTSLASAQSENIEDLSLGNLTNVFVEIASLYKITFRTNNSYGSTGKARIEGIQKIVASTAVISGSGSSSHSALSNLTSDDHPQYPLANGMYAGVTGTGPTITDNGDGTFDISSCQVGVFENTNFTGRINIYNIAASAGITPTDVTQNYLYVDYNGGSPQYAITTNVDLITESDVVPILTLYRDGNNLNIEPWYDVDSGLGNGLPNRLHMKDVKVNRFRAELENYPMLSESGTRNVDISACKIWMGGIRKTVPAFDSTVDDLYFHYHVAGVWTQSSVTQYNNTQYDDGTDLQSLTGNKITVNWIYEGIGGGKACIVLGNEEYHSLADALEAKPYDRTDLPNNVKILGFLVGRIIVQNGVDTALLIENAFNAEYGFSTSEKFMIKSNPTPAIVASEVDTNMESKDRINNNVLELDEDITVNLPTNIVVGSIVTYIFQQDSIGFWNVTFDTGFTGENGVIPAVTATPLKKTMYRFYAESSTSLVLDSVKQNF